MNYTLKIYDQLLLFPLFQGMSHGDLMEVVTHTKLGFEKYAAGKRIIRDGDVVTRLVFLVSGSMQCETHNDDHSCRVVETISAPYTIQAERLFGITQRYTTAFKALSPCSVITIDKQEALLLLETQLVFRLNMLNLLATEAQRLRRYAWRSVPSTLRERLIRYFFLHSLYPAGEKTFHVLMTLLADELNDSRLHVSQTLNQLQREGLLTLHRGRIEIPLLERLLM